MAKTGKLAKQAKFEPHGILLAALRREIAAQRAEGLSDPRATSRTTGFGGRETVLVTASQARLLGLVMTWATRPLPLPDSRPKGDVGRADGDIRRMMGELSNLREASKIGMEALAAYSLTTQTKAAAIERGHSSVEMRDLVRWGGWFGLHVAFAAPDDARVLGREIAENAGELSAAFAARFASEREALAATRMSRLPPEEIRMAIVRLSEAAAACGARTGEIPKIPDTIEALAKLLAPFGVRLAVTDVPGIATDVEPRFDVDVRRVERMAMGALRMLVAEVRSLHDARKVAAAVTPGVTLKEFESRPWGIDANSLAELVTSLGGGLALVRMEDDEQGGGKPG